MWRTLLFDDFAVPAPLAYVFSLSLYRDLSLSKDLERFFRLANRSCLLRKVRYTLSICLRKKKKEKESVLSKLLNKLFPIKR